MSIQSELHPDCRITIEVEPAVYGFSGNDLVLKSPAKLVELKDFTTVRTQLSTQGKSTATITFASHHDSAYNLAKKRDRTTRRQREIAEYLSDVFSVINVKEINPSRRPGVFEDSRLLKIPRSPLRRGLSGLSAYIRESQNGHEIPVSGPRNRHDEYRDFEWMIGQFKLMRRVWIDFKDHRDMWVAGFTGIVSNIQDTYTTGENPVVTIGCSGMMRFWEASEYITQAALENLEWPFPGGASEFPNSFYSNTLQGMSFPELMVEMATFVNGWFSLTGGTGSLTDRKPENFYMHDKLLHVDSDKIINNSDLTRISFTPQRNIPASASLNLSANTRPETYTDSLIGSLYVDVEATRNDNLQQDMIRSAFRRSLELFSFESASPMRIVQDACSVVNFEIFEDPRGNVNLWVPKYDSLPTLDSDGSNVAFLPLSKRKTLTDADLADDAKRGYVPSEPVSTPEPLSSTTFGIPPFRPKTVTNTNPKPLLTSIYGEDYSALPFHDRRYIIDDTYIRSWTLTTAEDALKTYCRVMSQAHILEGIPGNLAAYSMTGYTSYERLKDVSKEMADYIVQLNRRYGIRRMSLPTVYTNDMEAGGDLLVRLAYSGLIRNNAAAKSGVLQLIQRPDLWPGRTIFMAERQKLGYITQVTNTFTMRQAHTTTLTLSYVHDPIERIGNPWRDATGKNAVDKQPDIEGLWGEVFKRSGGIE